MSTTVMSRLARGPVTVSEVGVAPIKDERPVLTLVGPTFSLQLYADEAHELARALESHASSIERAEKAREVGGHD